MGGPGAPRRADAPPAREGGARRAGMPGMGGPGGGAYGRFMINELIPWVDSNFRTLANRDNRAMAGLSMGGRQTISVTMANLDTFSNVGLFSGGAATPRLARGEAAPATPAPLDFKTIYNGQMANPAEFNKKVKVFFFSCGGEENPDGIEDAPGTARRRRNHQQLRLRLPRNRTRMADLEEEPVYFLSTSVQVRLCYRVHSACRRPASRGAGTDGTIGMTSESRGPKGPPSARSRSRSARSASVLVGRNSAWTADSTAKLVPARATGAFRMEQRSASDHAGLPEGGNE